jgi:hypothetical protein
MEKKYQKLIAIAIDLNEKPYKYHIRNKGNEIINFENFLAKSGFGITHVNYYDKESRKFLIRHKI